MNMIVCHVHERAVSGFYKFLETISNEDGEVILGSGATAAPQDLGHQEGVKQVTKFGFEIEDEGDALSLKKLLMRWSPSYIKRESAQE